MAIVPEFFKCNLWEIVLLFCKCNLWEMVTEFFKYNLWGRIREASLFMCQGGAAFSYGGAENWRRGLGGAKKSVVDF